MIIAETCFEEKIALDGFMEVKQTTYL